MTGKIFINYRRAQNLNEAQHLATRLETAFGVDRVLIDVRSIDGFSEWLGTLKEQVAGSAAMLCLIGRDWAEVKDSGGRPRIEDPKDPVRLEIVEALSRGIPVLPVLWDGASVPALERLPSEITELFGRQARELHAKSFPGDADVIVDDLRRILGEQHRRSIPWAAAAAAAAALVAGLVTGPKVQTALGFLPPAEEVKLRRLLDGAKTEYVRAISERDQEHAARAAAERDLQDAHAALAAQSKGRESAAAARLTEVTAQLRALQDELHAEQMARNTADSRAEKAEDSKNMLSAEIKTYQSRLSELSQRFEATKEALNEAGSREALARSSTDKAKAEIDAYVLQTAILKNRLKDAEIEAPDTQNPEPSDNETSPSLLSIIPKRFQPLPATQSTAVPQKLGNPARLSLNQLAQKKPNDTFHECVNCPEMVVVPADTFLMGSPDGKTRALNLDATLKAGAPSGAEDHRNDDEGPQHDVKFSRLFAVGRFAVTFAEWDECVREKGCNNYRPKDQGWGRGGQPVINVSWIDAKAYVNWLSKKTTHTYRLLSEAEREYAARAGTVTPFWLGSTILTKDANYNGGDKGDYRRRTASVQTFEPNNWGLYQVHGNVWEWVEDCWHDSYSGAPADGSAWTTGGDCTRRVLRGGSWAKAQYLLRSAMRGSYGQEKRISNAGFRVAITLAENKEASAK